MRKEDIEQITKDAKAKGGSIDAAIAKFLNLELEFKQADNSVPPGCDGAFYNIRYEVEQYNNADKATREGIDAFKAAK